MQMQGTRAGFGNSSGVLPASDAGFGGIYSSSAAGAVGAPGSGYFGGSTSVDGYFDASGFPVGNAAVGHPGDMNMGGMGMVSIGQFPGGGHAMGQLPLNGHVNRVGHPSLVGQIGSAPAFPMASGRSEQLQPPYHQMPFDFQGDGFMAAPGMKGGGFASYGLDSSMGSATASGRRGDIGHGVKGGIKSGKDPFGGRGDAGGKSGSVGKHMDANQSPMSRQGVPTQGWNEAWKGGAHPPQTAPFNQSMPKGGRGKQSGSSNLQAGATHSNLFVSNLPSDVNEQFLRNAFATQGRVLSCRTFTRNERTCALVKMSTVQEAEQVCKEWSRQKGSGSPQSQWLVKMAYADAGFADSKGKDGQLPFGGGKGGNLGKAGEGFAGKSGKGGLISNQGIGGAVAPFASAKGTGKSRKEREPVDTTPSDNLYVKGLPPQTTEQQLTATFSKVGQVVELKILHYGDSLECAALVRMGSVESAQNAIDKLNGTTPDGSVPPISVVFKGKDPQAASDNLFVKGLPANFSQEHIQLLFGQHGTVRRCRILDAPAPNYSALGTAALVQMSSIEEASRAMMALNGSTPSGFSPQMVIRFAEPKPRNASELKPNANLFVKGLPLATPDFLLRAVFAQYGAVIRLKVLEPQNNEVTDCAALVQMGSIEEAKAAIDGLHGRMLATSLPSMRIRYAGKEQNPGANLYVAGLPFAIQEQQLRATFAKCGAVVRLRLLQQAGKPETHALVQMGTAEEAEAAIKQLNGQPPDNLGPILIVRYAQQRQKEKSGSDGIDPTPAHAAPDVADVIDEPEVDETFGDVEEDAYAASAIKTVDTDEHNEAD